MQGRIKVLKDVDKSNILPMTHAKAVYVDEKNTLDKTLNNIESQIIQQRKTYAELKELVENNKLIPGTQYVLIDYRSKYVQPTTNVIKEMDIEELIITASSGNTFEPIVYSPRYPSDTIWYDFDNDKCEDGTTDRNGFILRRYDPVSGNDAPQDWRTMLWARYKPHKTRYVLNGSELPYEVWISGDTKLKRIYVADNKLWMAKNTTTPSSKTDTNVFFEVYPDLDMPLLISEKTKWGTDIELIKGDLVEVPTFGAKCLNNKINSTRNNTLHNNIFLDDSSDNTLDVDSSNNTFGTVCTHNYLGSLSVGNIFRGCSRNNCEPQFSYNTLLTGCHYNHFGIYCSTNILYRNVTQNTLGARCYTNIFFEGCTSNSLGNECFTNTFGPSNIGNTLGNRCYRNVFDRSFSENVMGDGCYSNTFSFSCSHNMFGNNFNSNTFGHNCYYNTFGVTCASNQFSDNFIRNSFGNYNKGNKFASSCTDNSFGNDNEGNDFGSTCRYNAFFNNCDNNIFGDSFQHNVVENLFNKNVSTIRGALIGDATVTFKCTTNSATSFVYTVINSSNQLTIVNVP